MTQTYVERAPRAELAGAVRTLWVQTVEDEPYAQRHLPTGGIEIHVPIGGRATLLGPLTGPMVELIPAGTTVLGARFQPGAAPPLPVLASELVDRRVALSDLWGDGGRRIEDRVGRAAGDALDILQDELLLAFRRSDHLDPLVAQAVRLLMPGRSVGIGAVADELSISPSQLRRRCLAAVGIGPKALQRTLRFQGYLALAQAGAHSTGRRGEDGLAGLAIDVGYADHAHLGRECRRLTGLTPRQLLGGEDRCGCGHDHSASYLPFLAAVHDPFKRAPRVAS